MTTRAGVLILALSSTALSSLAPEYPALKDGYDFRYGIPPGTDLAALVDDPTVLAEENTEYFDNLSGENRMSGFADYHAVYDVSIESAKATLADLETYSGFMPWISGSTILSRDNNHYNLKFSVGINFLGAKVGYATLSECWIDYFPDGSVGLRSRMVESPTGNLFEHYLSWYLAPVLVNGKGMTYVRYYARPGLRRPSWLVSSLVKKFTEPNIRDQVSSFMKEAVRRQKNAEQK